MDSSPLSKSENDHCLATLLPHQVNLMLSLLDEHYPHCHPLLHETQGQALGYAGNASKVITPNFHLKACFQSSWFSK